MHQSGKSFIALIQSEYKSHSFLVFQYCNLGILRTIFINLLYIDSYFVNVILVLVAFSLLVAVGGLIAFFWSVRNGQYDDPYGSSVRILFEDDRPSDSAAKESGLSENANKTKHA